MVNLPNTVKNLILCQDFKMLIEISIIPIPNWILTCPDLFKVDTIICLRNVNTFSGIYPRLLSSNGSVYVFMITLVQTF